MPSIEVVLDRAREIGRLRRSEAHLNVALSGSRETGMAVGLLMMRDRLDRKQAFELLRNHARSQRRAVGEIAGELLNAAESLYAVGNSKKPGERVGRS
ncbi:MAG: ANTAR domain-containing protein [Betaproteobacteria bacterium]|nr:ANTAR domain-containing protein [Betaproteobacteria bacterium]